MREHLLVVGGGQAASQAILTARQKGFDGRITLVADEPFLPYQRPPLSKQYLAGTLPRERLALRPEAFYASRDVDVLLGRSAVEVDPARRRVRLDDAGELGYTSLLLATGSRVRRLAAPGVELAGIHYLRTVTDVDAIAGDFAHGRRLVVVGGGYIGLEVAAVAVARGLEVSLVEAAERLLGRVAGPEIAAFYADVHRHAGVDIHCGEQVRRFCGRTRVESVELDSGSSLRADLVVIGIGVAPIVELAERAGLACNDGICVDVYAATSAPAIAAAGDCTSHAHPFLGRRVRLESVHNAIEQGKAAGSGLVGERRAFDEVPWFWSDQYDLKLQTVGVARDYDRTVVRGDPASRSFSVYYLSRDRAVAVDNVNNPREFLLAKKLLPLRPRLSAERIADTGTDLAELVATES